MAAFVLRWHSWVSATETVCPANYSIYYPALSEKVCWPLFLIKRLVTLLLHQWQSKWYRLAIQPYTIRTLDKTLNNCLQTWKNWRHRAGLFERKETNKVSLQSPRLLTRGICISQPRQGHPNRIQRSHRADKTGDSSWGSWNFHTRIFLRNKLTRERVPGHGIPSESLAKY